jgi:DNA-binding response OmpR family regulator
MRIVIADDERDSADTLAALLEFEGHHVRAVYSGRDALNAAAHFAPDVVLLDVGMPGISGYEVARRLRERYAEECPALIAVTGWKKASDRILATIVGFDQHVAKPYEPRELVALLTGLAPRRPAASR